jgi:hypothetical protein
MNECEWEECGPAEMNFLGNFYLLGANFWMEKENLEGNWW